MAGTLQGRRGINLSQSASTNPEAVLHEFERHHQTVLFKVSRCLGHASPIPEQRLCFCSPPGDSHMFLMKNTRTITNTRNSLKTDSGHNPTINLVARKGMGGWWTCSSCFGSSESKIERSLVISLLGRYVSWNQQTRLRRPGELHLSSKSSCKTKQ